MLNIGEHKRGMLHIGGGMKWGECFIKREA